MNSVIKAFRQLFNQLDLFGKPVNLLVKKEQLYHTRISIFFSAMVIILSCVFFVYLLTDLVQLKNPNVTTKVQYHQNPDLYTLTKENFRISVVVADSEATPIPNPQKRLFNIYIQQCDLMLQSKIKRDCIKTFLVPCSEVSQNNLSDKLYLTADIDKYSYCVPDDYWSKDTLRLQGGLLSKELKQFSLIIRTCDKSCNNKQLILQSQLVGEDCESPEVIKEQLKSGLILFSLVDNQKDDSNPYQPYSPVYKKIVTTFDRTIRKDAWVYLRHSVMNSITNLFYFSESQQVDHVLQFDRVMESSVNITEDAYYLYIASFFVDEQKYIYTRTYDNILNMMGNLKGLFSFLTFVCGILVDPFQKTQMQAHILNKIFKFNNNRVAVTGKTVITKTKVSPDKGSQPQSKPQPKIQVVPPFQGSQFIQQFKEAKIMLKEKFFYLIGKTTNNMMCLAEKKLQERVDIVYIVNKLQEIDKLKYLLLNKNQLKLFEVIGKPEISISKADIPPNNPMEHQEYQNFMLNDRDNVVILKESMEAFKEIQNEISVDLNSKLMLMIDRRIKSHFEQSTQVMEIPCKQGQLQVQIPQKPNIELKVQPIWTNSQNTPKDTPLILKKEENLGLIE